MTSINLLRIYKKVISNFQKAGLYIDESKILQVKFSDLIEFRLGQLSILKNDTYSIEISHYLNCIELTDIIELTLYHELCHFLQVQELLSDNYLQIDSNGNFTYTYENRSFVVSSLETNNGHTHLWITFADIISNRFDLDLTETANDEISERIAVANNLCASDTEMIKESNIVDTDKPIPLTITAFVDYFKEDLSSRQSQILNIKYL